MGLSREDWTIYRGPSFLAVVWFGSTPAPFPPLLSANCLTFSVFNCVAGPAYWRERRGGGGVEPNHATAIGPLWIIQSSMVYRETVSQKAMAPKSTEWDLPKENSGIFSDPKKYSIRTLCKRFLRSAGLSLRFVNWSVQYSTILSQSSFARLQKKTHWKINETNRISVASSRL